MFFVYIPNPSMLLVSKHIVNVEIGNELSSNRNVAKVECDN